MKGYKAFNKDWKCKDFQYKIGETYKLSDDEPLTICKHGFHFCKNPIDVFGYYPFNDNTIIAEIEALGEIRQEGTKYCTNKIKIIREFTKEELSFLINKNNIKNNTGNYNTGDFNSGDYNSGNYNSGDFNSGDFNSGDFNSGDWNVGDYNSGSFNTGIHNDGCWNVGAYNSGSFNSGSFNSGNRNSGSFNSGKRNNGFFNTNEPYLRMFNKPTNISYSEFLINLNYSFFELLDRINKKALLPEDYSRIKSLPNFDKSIFKEITGIDFN